jgi:hypothetical protein
LPPVAAVLLGRTAGVLAGDLGRATPEAIPTPSARLVVALSMTSPDAAQTASTVIAERLESGKTPSLMGGEMADRPWAELFPQRAVRAVSGEPALLIELMPAPYVSPFILPDMLFRRTPGFLAWDW